MATISGEVRDENGDLLADCVVRAYRRDTGELLASGLSGDGSEEQAGDPDYASVALLLHCDGTNGSTTFTDSSGTPKTVTAYGNAAISTAQSKFGGASAYFDGGGDYLSVPNNADFTFGSGDFTIEFWVRASATGESSNSDIVSKITTAAEVAPFSCKLMAGSYTLNFYSSTGGTTWDVVNGALLANLSQNVWTHCAICRSGTNIYCFQDGVLKSTTAVSNKVIKNAAQPVLVGGGNYSNTYFNGYIDDLRITKGVARYTANFTTPSAAFLEGTIPARPLGAYTLSAAYTGECNVIALDQDGGTTFNDLILRTTPV